MSKGFTFDKAFNDIDQLITKVVGPVEPLPTKLAESVTERRQLTPEEAHDLGSTATRLVLEDLDKVLFAT